MTPSLKGERQLDSLRSALDTFMANKKLDVMRAIRPIHHDQVAEVAARGQYGPGWQGSQKVPGLLDEEGFSADSITETYAAITLEVHNRRWGGVPFYLRTGKAMGDNRRTATLTFAASTDLFGAQRNRVVLELTDEPTIGLHLAAKRPGPGLDVMAVHAGFGMGESEGAEVPMEAYERLLFDVMRGDQMLFTRADEVDRLWQICQPVLDNPPEVRSYPTGSWGPAAARALTDWHLPDD